MNADQIKSEADKIFNHVASIVGTPEVFDAVAQRQKHLDIVLTAISVAYKQPVKSGFTWGPAIIGRALQSSKAGEVIAVALNTKLTVESEY